MQNVEIAVIAAAGKGTRMRPLSLFIPKEMIPISSFPMLHYSIQEAVGMGCNEIALIVSPEKHIIRDYAEWLTTQEQFSDVTFHYVYQEKATGIADAILLAEDTVGDRAFAVMYPDDIFLPPEEKSPLEQIKVAYEKTGESVIAMEKLDDPRLILPYGNIKGEWMDDTHTMLQVDEIIEKPRPEQVSTPFATTGRYILTPAMFDYFRRLIDLSDKERYATEALNLYAQDNVLVAVPLKGIRRCDAGNLKGYDETFVQVVQEKKRQKHK